MERLYIECSDIPAVTHSGLSAHIQTVHKETSPRYHQLLEIFKEKVGIGIHIITNFNVRGEPIVCTPEDLYRCLMRTEMDYLVINDYLFNKRQWPDWKEKGKWTDEFEAD